MQHLPAGVSEGIRVRSYLSHFRFLPFLDCSDAKLSSLGILCMTLYVICTLVSSSMASCMSAAQMFCIARITVLQNACDHAGHSLASCSLSIDDAVHICVLAPGLKLLDPTLWYLYGFCNDIIRCSSVRI